MQPCTLRERTPLNSLLRVVSEYAVHNGSAIRLFLFGKWFVLTRTTTLRRLAQARYQYVGHSLGVGLPNAAASAPFDLMHRRLCSGSRLSRTLEKGEETARRSNSCAPPPYHWCRSVVRRQGRRPEAVEPAGLPSRSASLPHGDDRRTTRSGSRSRAEPGETSGQDCLLPIVCWLSSTPSAQSVHVTAIQRPRAVTGEAVRLDPFLRASLFRGGNVRSSRAHRVFRAE